MAPLESWVHSASETGLCFSKFNISKFGIFDMTLTWPCSKAHLNGFKLQEEHHHCFLRVKWPTKHVPHLWYLCFMYGDLLWPDLDLEQSLISNIYSISVLPYILGVLEVSFGPKLIILRSLRLVTWKPRFWLLTWPWPDTWPHLENLGML